MPWRTLPLFAPLFTPLTDDWGLQGSQGSSDEPLWADTHLQAANLRSWKRVVALKEEEGLPPEEQEGVGGASVPAHNSEAPPQTP